MLKLETATSASPGNQPSCTQFVPYCRYLGFDVIWAGFLILAATIAGFTRRELQEKITEALRAKTDEALFTTMDPALVNALDKLMQ